MDVLLQKDREYWHEQIHEAYLQEVIFEQQQKVFTEREIVPRKKREHGSFYLIEDCVSEKVYFVKINGPKRQHFIESLALGEPAWVTTIDKWILGPGWQSQVTSIVFCLSELNVEYGFVEHIIDIWRS